MNLSLLLCLSAFCFAPLAYASDCGQSLDGTPQNLDSEIRPDDRAVRWLEDLLGAVTNWPVDDALAAVTRLLAGSRESPVSESAVSNNPDLQVHREQLAELMQEVADPVAVGLALQAELDRREGTAQSRRETRKVVELDRNLKIRFGKISPGNFSVLHEDKSYLIVIPSHFWMMLTPVTRWQLGSILPAALRDDGQTENSPAVNISWYEAQAFVDELNRWARTNDPRLLRIAPDHQPTWRYSLPDGWEWMYVASNLAANSGGEVAWRQNSQLRRLTLGGFTSLDQAAHFFRDGHTTVNWEVDDLDPIIILGKPFHDLGGGVETWLRPDPLGPTNQSFVTIRPPIPKAVIRIQTPGILPKELDWFTQEVLGVSYYDLARASEIKQINSKDAPILGFKGARKEHKRATLGIRLIAFEADGETDARLDPDTPVDEAATIARLGADFLTKRIHGVGETIYARRRFKKHLKEKHEVMHAALKDWKQGQRNPEFEKAFQSDNELMKVLQHPALDLRRFAIEVEAQLKARGVMP